jgi:hypothetical protein
MRQAHTRAQASRASQGVGRKIAVRTRFFDDFLLDCCCGSVGVGEGRGGKSVYKKRRKRDVFFASVWRPWRWFSFMYRRKEGGEKKKRELIKNVLILGCGMDTRAWRLPLGENVTVVEVGVLCFVFVCESHGQTARSSRFLNSLSVFLTCNLKLHNYTHTHQTGRCTSSVARQGTSPRTTCFFFLFFLFFLLSPTTDSRAPPSRTYRPLLFHLGRTSQTSPLQYSNTHKHKH